MKKVIRLIVSLDSPALKNELFLEGKPVDLYPINGLLQRNFDAFEVEDNLDIFLVSSFGFQGNPINLKVTINEQKPQDFAGKINDKGIGIIIKSLLIN